MKHGPVVKALFFMQYLLVMLSWYWLFTDVLWARIVFGAGLLAGSILGLSRPKLFSVNVNVAGRRFPDRVTALAVKVTSWIGIPFGLLVLLGYRFQNTRDLGIFGLIFFSVITAVYIYGVNSSDRKEKDETKGYWIFVFSTLALFFAMCIFVIVRYQGDMREFTDLSPYPMMAFFFLMGIWHLAMISRRERIDAQRNNDGNSEVDN